MLVVGRWLKVCFYFPGRGFALYATPIEVGKEW